MATFQQPTSSGDWRHGLCDCCESCSDCCLAYLCPQCYGFCASQAAGQNMCCSILTCFFYPLSLCCLRSDTREQKAIDGGCCGDLCVSLLCPCCGVIQIKREFD